MTRAPRLPPELGGYVLAGGRSSRMGTDKALLLLAGKPLIAHAVVKLGRLCQDVRVLSANSALAPYAPLVPDLHPDCGPIGGIEVALAHSIYDWNLIYPVDLPFLPTLFLEGWARTVVSRRMHLRVALFRVFAVPQPALLMVHRTVRPYLTAAIARGEYKLLPALEAASRALAPPAALPSEQIPYILPVDENMHFDDWVIAPPHSEPWQILTQAQRDAQSLWFANLNTPQDFADAQRHIGALDT